MDINIDTCHAISALRTAILPVLTPHTMPHSMDMLGVKDSDIRSVPSVADLLRTPQGGRLSHVAPPGRGGIEERPRAVVVAPPRRRPAPAAGVSRSRRPRDDRDRGKHPLRGRGAPRRRGLAETAAVEGVPRAEDPQR